MNPIDDSLRRLLRSAAQTPQAAPPPLPANLETKLLASWRRRPTEDDLTLLLGLFRRAVVFAGLIMALSVTWNYVQAKSESANVMPLTDYALTIQQLP